MEESQEKSQALPPAADALAGQDSKPGSRSMCGIPGIKALKKNKEGREDQGGVISVEWSHVPRPGEGTGLEASGAVCGWSGG